MRTDKTIETVCLIDKYALAQEWLDQAKTCVDEDGEIIYRAFANKLMNTQNAIDGIPLTRLREICEAEKDGRCVVLLAINTPVYIVKDGEILTFRVYGYSLDGVNKCNVRYWAECISNDDEDDMDIWTDEIGKTVFLTRAEAEAKGDKQ